MSQTVCIICRSFLARVRISIRRSTFFIREKHPKPIAEPSRRASVLLKLGGHCGHGRSPTPSVLIRIFIIVTLVLNVLRLAVFIWSISVNNLFHYDSFVRFCSQFIYLCFLFQVSSISNGHFNQPLHNRSLPGILNTRLCPLFNLSPCLIL